LLYHSLSYRKRLERRAITMYNREDPSTLESELDILRNNAVAATD